MNADIIYGMHNFYLVIMSRVIAIEEYTRNGVSDHSSLNLLSFLINWCIFWFHSYGFYNIILCFFGKTVI